MKSQRNISSIQLAVTCLVLGLFTAWAQTRDVAARRIEFRANIEF